MAERKALTRVFSRGDNLIHEAGSMFNIDHLSAEDIAQLESGGIISREGETVVVISELEDVKGIGTEQAKALAAIGITTIAQLRSSDPAELERQLGTVTTAQIKSWQKSAKGQA